MRFILLLSLLVLSAVAQDRDLLLNPKALPARPPATLDELRGRFIDPPAEYRSMPLWVWNDEMEPKRMAQMLAQYKQQGMGGAFVHPRPGLITEYLGKDWFQLWRQALTLGKQQGLLVNIYDENSYPSGFAGGHVPSLAPDTASQFVTAELDVSPKSVSPHPLTVAFFAMTKDAQGNFTGARRVNTPNDVKPGESVISFRLRRASGNPWNGEFPYVDLTNPRTTPIFLQTTYEAYKREFGAEFGKSIKWAFTDEPLLATAGSYDSARLSLPLSFNTLSEFRKRNGYDLADQIPSLFWDTGDFRKVRFDYWQTLHDLWKENFMRPMFEWNDKNNLQFTGHWMEHEWPNPWITPADASLYAYEHVPGIDMLEGTNLRLQGKDAHMLFTIKQVASVSHQLGRRAFCEAYGVAGWDSTFEHYKRFGDWLMVNGVNFMNQHLSFTTIRGARKRDHPQSFSDVSAWWPYYRLHADHLARVSYLNSLSTPHNRVLLLQQTTSGFLLARRGGATPELTTMRENNATLNQFLSDHQVDYDLGDEYMAEWFGTVKDHKLHIAKAAYEILVLPPDLANLRHQTLPLLEKWLADGGHILSLSPPPAFVDGRPSFAAGQLRQRYAPQWHDVAGNDELLAELNRRLPRRIEIDAAAGFSERFLASGDRVLFLTNTTLAPIRTEAIIPAGSIELWNTETGKITPAVYSDAGSGRLRFPVDIAPAGSLLLIAKTRTAAPAKPAAVAWTPLPAAAWSVRAPAANNPLVLDYCDLQIGNERFDNVNTWRANWLIWQRHGFERPAWDNAVQFKRSVLDRNHFAKDSGFTATFQFQLDTQSVPRTLDLAVELPELYRITLNGKPVSFTAAQDWLDPHLKRVSIAALARTGKNVVQIIATPFDVHMELENIYILSGESVVPASGAGFRIAPAAPLQPGSWTRQGWPFFAGSMTYARRVEVPAGDTTLKLDLQEWNGSVARILCDGKQVALLGWPPYSAQFAITPGAHDLAVEVVSTPRNVMGPFHNPVKPRMRAWPAAWADFPDHQPPAAAYDFIDYGLLTTPLVSTGR
ncbi:MAG TPA: glycosyl hydrolase [Paludibaculum sp.]|jgi:hypothetical protein